MPAGGSGRGLSQQQQGGHWRGPPSSAHCHRALPAPPFYSYLRPPHPSFAFSHAAPRTCCCCLICTAHHLHCPCRPHPAPKLHFCPCTSCSRAAAPCSFILITSTHCLCFLVKTSFKVEQSAVRVLQEAVPPRVLPRVSHPSGLRFCVLGTVRVAWSHAASECSSEVGRLGRPRPAGRPTSRGPALSSPYSPK